MKLIDKFPTTGWKNPRLKELVQKLVEMESEFEQRKAPTTLGSILLTLGNVYKDDANQISTLLARPVPNMKRTEMKIADPNPSSLANFEPDCDTCPGAKPVNLRSSQLAPQEDVIVNMDTPDQSELNATLLQVVGEENLVVSEEHTKSGFASPEEVWKYFSGDLKKLQDAAEVAGIKNAKYDQVPMSLAKKIYNAQ
jgi:hypothetical protein